MTALEDIDLGPLSAATSSGVVATGTDGVVAVRSLGNVDVASTFRIASLTKPLTAVATVLAAQHAGIGLETAVWDVLPALHKDWNADPQLTLTDLLSQTSGLASIISADDIAQLGDGDSALVEAARLVVRAGNARPRGRTWEYYNGNYFMAGAAIEALTGTSFEQALHDLLIGPWGLNGTSFETPGQLVHGVDGGRQVSATHYPRGRRPSGGLYSTAEDLLAFGQELLCRADLLDTVRAVRTWHDDAMRYGLAWAIGPSGQMYLNGRLPGYRAALMLVPEHTMAAVALAPNSDALPALARILSELQLELTGDDLTMRIDSFAA